MLEGINRVNSECVGAISESRPMAARRVQSSEWIASAIEILCAPATEKPGLPAGSISP